MLTVKKMMTIALASLLSLLFIAGGLEAAIAEGADNYQPVAQNACLLLEADMDTGLFRLTDKVSGYVRYSVPPDAESDPLALGANRMQLQSQLVVYYRNEKSNIFVANSKVSCVNRKNVTVSQIEDGIHVDFNFAQEGFMIPVEVTLKDDCLEVTILTGDVQESGKNLINKIDVLPYFLCGGQQEEGYMLVPDGSGALIHFNNGKSWADDYYAPVYGPDLTLGSEVKTTNNEVIRLPVCGLRNSEEAGILGMAVSGDAQADIGAGVSGRRNSYNHVWFTFRYREEESIAIMEMDMNNRRDVISMADFTASSNFTLRFYPLSRQSGGTDYSAMAQLCRSCLKSAGVLNQNALKTPLLLDVLGAAKVERSVLGVPVEQLEPLTTVSQLSDITQELQSSGVSNFSARLKGFGEEGMKNVHIPVKLTIANKLGGLANLKTYCDAMAEASLRVYLDVDPISFMKRGGGVTTYSHSVKNIFSLQSWQEKEDWLLKRSVFAPYLLLTPEKVAETNAKYMDSLQDAGLRCVAMQRLGDTLYSDFSDDRPVDRTRSARYWADTLSYAAGHAEAILLDGGNAPVLPYANVIARAPVYSSGYAIEDETVPFYAMVTHGSVALAVSPLNLSSDIERLLIRAVESGMGLSFVCSAEDTQVLKTTEFNSLYAGRFSDWYETIAEMYGRVSAFYDRIYACEIIKHTKVKPGVYKTLYDNSAYSLVNYNTEDIDVEGTIIPAMNFVAFDDGEKLTEEDRNEIYAAPQFKSVFYWRTWMSILLLVLGAAGLLALWRLRAKAKHGKGRI